MLVRAFVLDVTHRLLLRNDDGALTLPSLRAAPGERALPQLVRALEPLFERVPLGEPWGMCAPADFAWVLSQTPTAPAGHAWRPLHALPAALADEVWPAYCAMLLGGWLPPTGPVDVFAFGDTPAAHTQLAHLVVKGRKRGSCWLADDDRDGAPEVEVGGYGIVLDGMGAPLCCIRTHELRHVRFCDVDAALAATEGEGDLSLEYWRAVHRDAFGRQRASGGRTFDDDTLLVFERFDVVKVFGA